MFTNQDLKKMIVPLVAEQILLMLVGMADTMMISYAGEAAISGVSLVDMVNNLIICILSAIATGGAVIVSQYLGNQEHKQAQFAASQLMLLAFLSAFVVMLVCLFFHRQILRLFFGSVQPDVMQAAITYFFISALSFPFLGLYNAGAALFRSMGKTKTTMYVSILMNIINVVGNAVGVLILHLGVVGVAVPTLISRAVAAVVMLVLALNPHRAVSVSWQNMFSWDRTMMHRIIRIALPNGIENGLFHFGRVLVTSIVALFGTSQIAANGVANSVDQFAIIVVNAINLAIVTVVGQDVGARRYDLAKKDIKKLMKLAYLMTAILNLVVFVLLNPILQLYTLSIEARQIAYVLIISHNLLALLLHPTSFVLANGIRASGDVRYTMYVGIASMIVFRLGTAYVFGILLNWGVYGVWLAMGADWLCRSVAFLIRFISGKWEHYRAI